MLTLCVILSLVVSSSAFVGSRVHMRSSSSGAGYHSHDVHTLDDIEIKGELEVVANYVLVKVREAVEQTKGGVYIPGNAKERPTEGKVIAHGPGRVHPHTGKLLVMPVKVGSNVIYGKYDGTELNYDHTDHQLIRDDDILLVYDGDKDATLNNVQCVKDQVLILLDKIEDIREDNGLVYNDNESKGYRLRDVDTGVVVKVGPGRQAGNQEFMTNQIEPGQYVKFRDFAGANIQIDGKEYAIIRAYDILAVISQDT
jgi:chaperonin GroES